jgi:hypothetical protein
MLDMLLVSQYHTNPHWISCLYYVVVFCHIHCTLHYIIQGVDTLQIKKNTRCLFGTGKLTTTYQAYKNFYYTYIIMHFLHPMSIAVEI